MTPRAAGVSQPHAQYRYGCIEGIIRNSVRWGASPESQEPIGAGVAGSSYGTGSRLLRADLPDIRRPTLYILSTDLLYGGLQYLYMVLAQIYSMRVLLYHARSEICTMFFLLMFFFF